MKPKKLFLGICMALLLGAGALGQSMPFVVEVREAANEPAPALQSFAYATDGGRWLLVGGRTNGFHRTSTHESTFPSAQSNEDLYVVDPAAGQAWKARIPDKFLYPLRSTNMEYYQDGNILYLVGGYGSNCSDDKPECYHTFSNLTAIRVHDIVEAIVAHRDVASYIVSITDDRMKVTGGELAKLGGNFYLTFGQDFEGIYQGTSGKYTEQVRRFKINFDGARLSIGDYQEFNPPDGGGAKSQFHRRDLNVVETVRPDLRPGLTAYGGVFQGASAWTNPINIDQDASGKTTITVDTSFSQKMSQYNCARLAMFSARYRTMFTTLFGGISLYFYDKSGKLVESTPENNLMPFINSISTIAQLAGGRTVEWPQPPSQSLPRLIGADAVFIPAPKIPTMSMNPNVLDYDKLPGSTLVGYIYGGIHALDQQISGINPSYASSTIYAVYLKKLRSLSNDPPPRPGD